MLPDRVSNPGPLTYESGALPIALHGPAKVYGISFTGRDEIRHHLNKHKLIIESQQGLLKDEHALSIFSYYWRTLHVLEL